jgi:hypothetical protein
MSAATEKPPDPESSAPSATNRRRKSLTTQTIDQVKSECRQHIVNWLETGHGYHLRLARAKFDALRKGAA